MKNEKNQETSQRLRNSYTVHVHMDALDFEDYIKTNEVQNEVLINHPKKAAPSCYVVITPNPVKNSTKISLVGRTETEEGVFNNPIYFKQINLMTMNGVLITSIENTNKLSLNLSLNELAQGIYLIEVINFKGNKYFGKLMKN